MTSVGERVRLARPFRQLAEKLFEDSLPIFSGAQPKSSCKPLGGRRQAADDYRQACLCSPKGRMLNT